jgi:hypothetical protein
MKKFTKISVAGWACGLFLTTASYAAEPYSFGLRLNVENNTMTGLDKAKTPFGGKEVEASMLNIGVGGGTYGEYVFHDMIGLLLKANFSFMGATATISEKGKTSDKPYTVTAKRVNINLGPVFYPMGYDDNEDGILKVNVGLNLALPVGDATAKKGEEKEVAIKSDEFTPFGIGATLGVNYELPIGVFLELGGLYEFTPYFKEDSKYKTQTLGVGKTDVNNLINASFGLGYNLGILLED